MAPVARSDIDLDSRTSSPQPRQISEPLHAQSTSTTQAKCPWCGEYYFESLDEESHDVSLKEHMALVHPHLARNSSHDDVADDEEIEENGHVEDEPDDDHYDEQHENDDEDDAVDYGDEAEDPEAAEEADHGEDGGWEDAYDGDEQEHSALDANGDYAAEFDTEYNSYSGRKFPSAEKRLYNRWNIHDVHNFSRDYDETVAQLAQDWGCTFSEAKYLKKRNTVELPERPDPYKKPRVDRGKFLELTPIEGFLVDLRDPETRSAEELYAITENAAHALATWQDEYFAVDQLYKLSIGQYEKLAVDPRKRVEDPDVAADKKEALLYQYKYDAVKHKKNQEQDPWVQGGFRPTPTQVRKALKTTKFEPGITPNIDGWPSLHKFGVEYVPKYQDPPPEDAPSKATRTRKAAEMEAAAAADEARQAAAEEEEQLPSKRQTRSTRIAHEAMEDRKLSSPKASASRGTGRGRGHGRGQGRGRGRGRGGTSAPSGPSPETPTPPIAQAPSISRGRGRGSGIGRGNARGGRGRGKGRAPSTPIATPRQTSPTPLTPALTSRPTSVAPPPNLAPIEPRPNGFPPMMPLSHSPTEMMLDQPEELDPAEMERRDRARAEKIANSKNPRRTEAMLNHWARFNRAGRIRNPKRSKDEIEAARSDAAVRRATQPPKASGRKKKSPPLPGSATLINAGIAPAPMPGPGPAGHAPHTTVPGVPAPGPTQGPPQLPIQPPPGRVAGQSLSMHGHTSLPSAANHHPLGPGGPLAPHPQPRYTTPYPPAFGPIDPRGMGPFPPGPFQPPPPPARYQTPYPPDYFLPFGTAHGASLPPPSHARRPA